MGAMTSPPFNLDETRVTMIAGGIALVLSVVLLWYYSRSKKLLDEMWAVDTYDARELRRMCSGGFRATVEVQGNVTCDQPVIAPASKFPCCWCRTIVERQETQVRASRTGIRTEHVWIKEYDFTIFAIFKVNDSTGYTLVNPLGADIETEAPYKLVTNEHEPWFTGVGYSDTGMYRITETIFVPTGFVYVLGQASCAGEGTDADVLIHEPSEGYIDPRHKVFLISRKTEKQLAESQDLSLAVSYWGAVIGLLFAAYCILSLVGVVP